MVAVCPFIGHRNPRIAGRSRAAAREVQIFGDEEFVAEVECDLIGHIITNTGQKLVSDRRVGIAEAINRDGRIVGQERAQAECLGVNLGKADTSTEIGLDLAFRVEIVKTVKHQIPDTDLAVRTGIVTVNRGIDRRAAIDHAVRIERSATVTNRRFKTEAIVETIAEAKLTTDQAAIEAGITPEGVKRIGFWIVIQRAVETVTEISTAIPAVLRYSDITCRRHSGRSCRAHQSLFHTHPLL